MGIQITNDIQIVLVKYMNPTISGRDQFNEAIGHFVAVGYAEVFRFIIDADNHLNPDNRLLDLWDEDRGKDHHGVIPFLADLMIRINMFEHHLVAVRHIIGEDLFLKFKQDYREKVCGFLRGRNT